MEEVPALSDMTWFVIVDAPDAERQQLYRLRFADLIRSDDSRRFSLYVAAYYHNNIRLFIAATTMKWLFILLLLARCYGQI